MLHDDDTFALRIPILCSAFSLLLTERIFVVSTDRIMLYIVAVSSMICRHYNDDSFTIYFTFVMM
jgi:hypothetical protein